MNKIGVMQGRLTDKGGFYPQSFPSKNWKQEFFVAAEIGFECIEWMFNDEDWFNNPVMVDEGVNELNNLVDKTGICVNSICANYFMKHSIYSADPREIKRTEEVLERLIENAKKIQCANIIIPMFEESELSQANGVVIDAVKKFLDKIERNGLMVLFESDVEAKDLKAYVRQYESNSVGVCFDLGNIVGLGRNLQTEIEELGHLIKNVHIKDKKILGTTVMLGEGDVDFNQCLHQLSEITYKGNYVLESYYNVEAISDTIKNYEFLKGVLGR